MARLHLLRTVFFDSFLTSIFSREMETRQKIENEKRHLVTDNKNLHSTIHQLETDVNDLKQALTEEQEARAVQVKLFSTFFFSFLSPTYYRFTIIEQVWQ